MRRLARNSLAAFFVAVVMGGAPPSPPRSFHRDSERHAVGHCCHAVALPNRARWPRGRRKGRDVGWGAYDSHVPLSRQLRIAMVSMHTSPLDAPGSGDAGGMNVVERHTAEALAELGHQVDLITRRSDPGQPDVVDLGGESGCGTSTLDPRSTWRSRRSTRTWTSSARRWARSTRTTSSTAITG